MSDGTVVIGSRVVRLMQDNFRAALDRQLRLIDLRALLAVIRERGTGCHYDRTKSKQVLSHHIHLNTAVAERGEANAAHVRSRLYW